MNFNKLIFVFLLFSGASSSTIFAMKPANTHTNKARKYYQAKPHKQLPIKQQKKLNNQLLNGIDGWTDVDMDNIRSLLARGAQVNARDIDGRTTLMKAAALGHNNACQLLLSSNASANKQNKNGRTALMDAAQNGHDSLCELLINHGAQINTKNNDGNTALMQATRNGCESIIKLLIDHGAEIDTQSNCGETPLYVATSFGYASIVKILLERGAQFDTKCHGSPALPRAISNGDELTIRALITSYNTFSPENEFQTSRQRVWTALCVFKRYCPSMPKDIRKLILYILPELAIDVGTSGAFGSYKNLPEAHAPFAPLPIVRLLIKQGKLQVKQTVAAVKMHHMEYIYKRLSEYYVLAYSRKIRTLIHPNNFWENFEAEIEWNIKRRLGLPLTWTATATSLIPESCSIQ